MLLFILGYGQRIARKRLRRKDAIYYFGSRFLEIFEFAFHLVSVLTHSTANNAEISAILLQQGDESCYFLAAPSRGFPSTSNPLLFGTFEKISSLSQLDFFDGCRDSGYWWFNAGIAVGM